MRQVSGIVRSIATEATMPQSPRKKRPKLVQMLATLAAGAAIPFSVIAAERPEVLWAEQQVVFWAEPDTGAVHAVGVRSGVSEFGVLRAPQRRAVSQLTLDAKRAVLTVAGDDAVYHYDARNLRLLSRDETRVARAPQSPQRWVE
jgi:hypothetical protein